MLLGNESLGLVSDKAKCVEKDSREVATLRHRQYHWGASWFTRPPGLVINSVSGKLAFPRGDQQALGLLTRRLLGNSSPDLEWAHPSLRLT